MNCFIIDWFDEKAYGVLQEYLRKSDACLDYTALYIALLTLDLDNFIGCFEGVLNQTSNYREIMFGE